MQGIDRPCGHNQQRCHKPSTPPDGRQQVKFDECRGAELSALAGAADLEPITSRREAWETNRGGDRGLTPARVTCAPQPVLVTESPGRPLRDRQEVDLY